MMTTPDAPPAPQRRTTLDWAIYYASLGWSVVPVRRGEKIPAMPWARLQTFPADEMAIRSWLDIDTSFGIGLIQGIGAGTIVLDFDARDGGMETLAQLEARGMIPANTPRALTPGGGAHIILRHPGRRVPTRKGVLPGMDVRGDGGFIVAHPSIHENGRRYEWDVDAHPEDMPVADCPGALVDIICGPVSADSADTAIVRMPVMSGLVQADRVTDGREQYMRDTILAVLREQRDALGRLPTEEELFAAAWQQYSARVDFSRPGRGPEEMRAKVAYTLARVVAGQVKGVGAAPDNPRTDNNRTSDNRDGVSEATPQAPKKSPLWIDPGAWLETEIPKRPWLVPSYFMAGSVSVLSGQGAGGKSSIVVAWTIAAALGAKLGEFKPVRPLVCINYNVEDDKYEQQRRYSAALKASGHQPQDVAGKVIRCGPHDVGTLFERDPVTGRITQTAAMETLENLCMETEADILICDPLAELHNSEENDNTAMRAVIAAFRGLAQRLGISVMILHHDRKGNNAPGDMDRLRGASAITGAVRVMLTLSTMSNEEAEKFGIKPEDRRRHFRIDGAKSNYAIAQEAEWWKLAGYTLANEEEVAACRPWTPPSPFDGISQGGCIAAIEHIARGGWAVSKKSGEWAARKLVRFADKDQNGEPLMTEHQAEAVLAAWVKNGVLHHVQVATETRNQRQDYAVTPEGFAKMRQGFKA